MVVLIFESSFWLFYLELFLLQFESADDLLQFVDRAASLSKLVGQVLDFLGQLAVLTASSLEMLGEFIVGGLGAEQIGGEIAVVTLGSIKLAGQVVGLFLPFFDDAVEALLLLLQGGSIGSSTLDIDLEHIYKRLWKYFSLLYAVFQSNRFLVFRAVWLFFFLNPVETISI